jgi:hypothetical protein
MCHIPLRSARCVALFRSLARCRNRGISDLRVSPSGIVVGDFIQAAYAVYDNGHPTEKHRNEGSHCPKNEGRPRRLRHHLRNLTSIGDKVHASTSISEVRAVARYHITKPRGMKF